MTAAEAQLALKKYLDTVARRQSDRRVDGKQLIELLKGKPKKKVELLYNPNDPEAWTLAQEIFWWLGDGPAADGKGAGWTVFSPKPIPANAGMPGFADAPPGMRFFGSYSTSGLTFRAKDISISHGGSESALTTLTKALMVSIFHGEGTSFASDQDQLIPDDLIVVIVLPKPTWLWGLEKP